MAGGGSESPSCGAGNLADCLVTWMAVFNPYRIGQRLYRPQGTLKGAALSAVEAERHPHSDWWLSIESNVEDAAEVDVSLTLAGAVVRKKVLCFFERFCPTPYDTTKRYRGAFVTVQRDAGDEGIGSAAWVKSAAPPAPRRSGRTATLAAAAFGAAWLLLRARPSMYE